MPKICQEDGCSYNVFGKGFCKYHQYKRADKKLKTSKKPKRLKLISKKMEVKLAEYRLKRDSYMLKNPFCEFTGCNKLSNDLHHKAGRGPNLSNTETFMAVCRRHHNWIHDNPKEARNLKYLI
jgi:hypothetical protein